MTGDELDVLAGDHDPAAGVHFRCARSDPGGSADGGRRVEGVSRSAQVAELVNAERAAPGADERVGVGDHVEGAARKIREKAYWRASFGC